MSPGIKALLDILPGGGRGVDQNKLLAFQFLRDQGKLPLEAAQLAGLGGREIQYLQAQGELSESTGWSSQNVGGVDRSSAKEQPYLQPEIRGSQKFAGPDIPTPRAIEAPGLPTPNLPGPPGLTKPDIPAPALPSLVRLDVSTPVTPNPITAAVGGNQVLEVRTGVLADRPLLGADAPRTDASLNTNAPGQTTATTTTEAVRDPSNVIQTRQEGRHAPNPESDAAERGRGRGDEGRAANHQARDGVQASTQSSATVQARDGTQSQSAANVQGRTDGGSTQVINTAAAQAIAQQTVVQQGNPQAQQAPSGDQARAQQARLESPIPQNTRAGEAAASTLRNGEAANQAAAAGDRNITTTQQQLHPQYNAAVPQAQGRPDSLFGQVAPQQQGANVQGNPQAQARPDAVAAQAAALAGATAMVNPTPNPQAHTMTQIGQNAMPNPAGVDAAAAARDPLLAPAGHTLGGFLRRDHRGGQSLLNRPLDWLAALFPGAQKRPRGSEPEVMSTQWLFWVLTVVAYGALGAAAALMIPSGGQLITTQGGPAASAYLLVLGALAAGASWLIARRMR